MNTPLDHDSKTNPDAPHHQYLEPAKALRKSARRTPEERMAEAIRKRDEANARVQRMQAKLRSDEERKLTREKIILGAALIGWMKTDAQFAADIKAKLRAMQWRDHDKEVIAHHLT